MATAGRGVSEEAVEMIPKGMLAREKCEVRGMFSQDFAAIFAIVCRSTAVPFYVSEKELKVHVSIRIPIIAHSLPSAAGNHFFISFRVCAFRHDSAA